MRIQMRTGLSGPDYSLRPGDEHDFPNDEAIRLIGKGYAVPVATRDVETAVRQPDEVRAAPDASTVPASAPAPAAAPFGGKGDHDGTGKVGGATRPARKARR